MVGHRPPGMVLRSGLGEPDVARIARQPPLLEGAGDGVAVDDLAARGVDQIGATLSGSGPTVIVWADAARAAECASDLEARFPGEGVLRLAVAPKGAVDSRA